MGAAEGAFDFDLKSKKRSSLATIVDKNSYTVHWIPIVSQGHMISYADGMIS